MRKRLFSITISSHRVADYLSARSVCKCDHLGYSVVTPLLDVAHPSWHEDESSWLS
jgi:hypothetical protein